MSMVKKNILQDYERWYEIWKHKVKKHSQAIKEAAEEHIAQKEARMRKVANSVLDQRHQQMMVVKEMEDAQTPDPGSKEPQELIAKKGPSPDSTGQNLLHREALHGCTTWAYISRFFTQ